VAVLLQSLGPFVPRDSIAKDGPLPNLRNRAEPSQQSVGFAVVNSTLVLLNHTLLPGNAAVENGLFPQGLAYDSVSGLVYVTTFIGQGNGRVVCLNASTGAIVKWFTVGKSPIGITFDPVNNFVYVDNGNSNNITVINGSSNNILTSIAINGLNGTSGTPEEVAVDTATGTLYVVTAPNTVTLVNTTTDRVVKNITVGDYPVSVYYDSASGEIFVANTNSTNSSSVSVIDGTTESVIGSIPVGFTPTGITYDSLSSKLYVTNFNSDNISVINTTSLTVVSSISLWTHAFTSGANMIATGLYGRLLYVSNYFRGVVAVINASTNTVMENLTVGTNPMGIAVDIASGRAFVAAGGGDSLSVLSGTNPSVVDTVYVGTYPTGIAFDVKRGMSYVADSGSARVLEVNDSSSSYVGFVSVGNGPEYLALDSANGLWYVANGRSDNISIFTSSTGAVVGSIQDSGFGLRIPAGIAYDSSNGNVYAAINGAFSYDVDVINTSTNTITQQIAAYPKPYYVMYDPLNDDIYVTSLFNDLTVINGTTNSVVENISVGLAPNGMALDISNGYLYVTNYESGNVTVINGSNQHIVGWIQVGSCPDGVIYDPNDGYVYVANTGSNNVSVIDGRTDRVVGSIPVGTGPSDLAVSPLNGDLYVTNAWSGTVSIISLPGITSVSVSPTNQTLFTGSNATFVAEPMCKGGPCPSGIQYSWSTNNSLGTVAPTTGAATIFDAGGKAGRLTLGVVASMDGTSAEGDATIAIGIPPPLVESVSISPPSTTVEAGAKASFVASPMCNASPCPSQLAFAWALDNSNLGGLNASAGAATTFTAGLKSGTLKLTVVATLNGKTAWANATITIQAKPTSGFLGLSGSEVYILLGVIVAAVAAVAGIMRMRKRAPSKPASSSKKEPEEEKAPEKAEGKEIASPEPEKKD
jgi:YVTN family beta-propeller protein